jgi:bacterioferritin (cytochrome b1)
MNNTIRESRWLNFYRASELHGGLVLGQLARRVRDPRLMLELMRHGAEEMMHAQQWAETILAIGGSLAPVRATYQRRMRALVGPVSSVFQVLALTQVFEQRVYRHFIDHARRDDTHPIVRSTLERMVAEERQHLSWVRDWLEEEAEVRGVHLRDVLHPYRSADARLYRQFVAEYGFRDTASESACADCS